MKNIIEYKSTNTEIVFCIVDNTSQIKNDWTTELVKNLSDFVLSNIVQKGYTVLQGVNEDTLLASTSAYKHAVVLSTGTEYTNGSAFFEAVEEAVTQDYFLQGHIPNRDTGYFELHNQCYIINLETYRSLGMPEVGKFSVYDSHTQVEPICSDEHIHDDYTPIWVKPGTVEKHYQHKWHGWNILSVAFENNLPVLVFDESIRNNKQFYYPDYQPSFELAQEYLYGKQSVSSQALFYPFNTESITSIDTIDTGSIDQLVTQASGLNWIEYLIDNGYNENTLVNFVDHNTFALECMQFVTHWDGFDYPNAIANEITRRTKFMNVPLEHRLAMPVKTLTAQWQQFLEKHPDWDTIWDDIKSNVTFHFTHADLVLNRSLPVEHWLKDRANTVVHLSHIFNYDPVAPFIPLHLRIKNENNLINKIKEFVPQATIIFEGRSAEGFAKLDKSYYKNNALQMPTINLNQVTIPTWHYGDWE